jgi:hypothetical protein
MPEPPDNSVLLWPARDDSELPVVILRDDQLAAWLGDPEKRWHTPNTLGASATWAVSCEIAEANQCPMSEAIRLHTQAEVDEAVAQAKADAGLTPVGES